MFTFLLVKLKKKNIMHKITVYKNKPAYEATIQVQHTVCVVNGLARNEVMSTAVFVGMMDGP